MKKIILLLIVLGVCKLLPAQMPGFIIKNDADAPLQNATIKNDKELVAWINKVRATIPRWFKELVPGGDVPEVMKAIGGGYQKLNFTIVDTLNFVQLTGFALQCHLNGYLFTETELLCFAAKIKPIDYNTVNNIGANLFIIGKPQVGITALKYLASVGYKEAVLYNNLGQAYYALQKDGIAKKYLDTSINLYPTGHATATRGKIEEKNGEKDKAIDDYKNALKETFNEAASERLDELAPEVVQSALLQNSPYSYLNSVPSGGASNNIQVPDMPNNVDDYYAKSGEAGALLAALIQQSVNMANQAFAVYVAHAENNKKISTSGSDGAFVVPLNIEKKLQKIFIAVDEQYFNLMLKKRETLVKSLQGVITGYSNEWNTMQKDYDNQLQNCKNTPCIERVKNTFCNTSKKLVSSLIHSTAPSYNQFLSEAANITKQRLQLSDQYAAQFFDKEDKQVAAQDVVMHKKGILDEYASMIGGTGVSAFMEPMGCEKHQDGTFSAPDVPEATVPPCPVIDLSVPTVGSLVLDCSELHIAGSVGLTKIKGVDVSLAFEYERQIQKHENTITIGPSIGPASAQISITVDDKWNVSDVSAKGSILGKSLTYSTQCGLY